MPISPEIYAKVDLKLDGKPVGAGPVILQSGSTVEVEGVILAHPDLDRRLAMDGGFGLVTRAENEQGWLIRTFDFFHSNTRAGRCTFDGTYQVPDQPPGEYLLVVISAAHVGGGDHPMLLAAQYDAVIVE
jgi:hypothetical protein